MARKAKVDNAILKRLSRGSQQRKQGIREIRKYVLIICEGEKTEPAYFEGLKADLPKGVLDNCRIFIEGQGKNTKSLVEAAIESRNQRQRDTGKTFDETWVVFDRDSFSADQFNGAIFQAGNAVPPIRCAWTNEAFELWYCLHFCYVNHAMPRKDYKAMIELELEKKLGRAFSYEKNDPAMYQYLKIHGSRKQAIAWAGNLAAYFAGQENFADQNPCTRVHLLVEALEALGKEMETPR
ncbi:MAG: RloB family protein [Bacteroidia bacterium]|nr:RloB family protein [Bacteroidia bacterium]